MPRTPDGGSRGRVGRIAAISYLAIWSVALASFLFLDSLGELSGLALAWLTLPWTILFARMPSGTSHAFGYVLYSLAAMVNASCISFFLGGEFFWFRRSHRVPLDRSEQSP